MTMAEDCRSTSNRRQPAEAPFVKELIKVWRAQDTPWCLGQARPTSSLLEPYILDKEARRALPIIGDPDPETIWRLELFYNAVALVDRARHRRDGVADDEDAVMKASAAWC